jgi:hypothetical protein
MRHPRSGKSSYARPLADLVAPVLDPVLVRRGFGHRDIVSYWDEIVGERLAAVCQPLELKWPARSNLDSEGLVARSATLVVRVESGFALELQQTAGQVVDRVNAHLGWRCVSRLVLRQGPIERRDPARRERPRAGSAAMAAAARLVTGVADDDLRGALTRLGAQVITREQSQSAGAIEAPARGAPRPMDPPNALLSRSLASSRNSHGTSR